ncbi:hypothetical protein [Angelakisella massiliensis]|uniref:hypothetical protein n=1 Tax=Angelakisella massiliensis TaxID=1871018 RepID=UPI0023A7C7BD|nr:hypothetical protein [Angelakisella massiliensis]
MKYLYTNIQLGDLLEVNGIIHWEQLGFSIKSVRSRQIQGEDSSGNFISLLPVENEAVLAEHIARVQLEPSEFVRIVGDEEYETVKADILAVRQVREEAAALTPTDEDLYRASVLKLLTEIKMNGQGGTDNV